MYYNSIVDHYGISKIIITISIIIHDNYYTNNTKLSMAQLLYTIQTTALMHIYHTAESNTIQVFL